MSLVAEILNNIEKVHEDRIFDRLTEIDPELAEDIRNEMFTLDDLIHIDDAFVTLLKEIDKQVLVSALKTAEEVKQFFSNIYTAPLRSERTSRFRVLCASAM